MDATEVAPRQLVAGRYRLGRRLGSGGFGTVYAAHDERLDRPVALKLIPAHGPAPERAQREALAAARLHHPGIVAVYDAGDDPEGRYLVSELVQGRTLDVLQRDGALSDRDVLRVGLALAEALGHAHERGVIHRDVKPQNVIVPDERGGAKLTDFGVAHLAGDEPLTRTGDVVGTLAYMAPEQAAGERVDERADLYSLALVLYESLTGVNPARGPSPAATARLVGTVLPGLRTRRRDLPAGLCAALDRALAPAAEARGTLAELADALATALPQVPDKGGTIAPHPLERARRPRAPLGRAAAGLAAGGLTALALAAAANPPAWATISSGGAGATISSGGAAATISSGGAAATISSGDVLVAPLTGAAIACVLVVVLPRVGWLIAAAGCVAALAEPWPAAAALVAAAAVVPPILLWRRGLVWSVPATAPALGLATLGGAYPAIAGRARGAWVRAALGAAGLWWLLLAEPLLDRDLALGTPPGDAADVLEAIATSGALLLAPLWALAALVLPWLVPGRSLALDVVGATVWAAGLAAATAAVTEYAGLAEPRGLAAAAIVAGVVAVIGARARNTLEPEDDRP
jgi:eukaryotic-like serine/threonine-protein kinase